MTLCMPLSIYNPTDTEVTVVKSSLEANIISLQSTEMTNFKNSENVGLTLKAKENHMAVKFFRHGECKEVSKEGDDLLVTVREDLPKKENVDFRAFPKLALPPLPPIQTTWSSFFRRQEQRIARMTEKVQMMMMMVDMIIMMVMVIILMKLMTTMTKKHTNIMTFE